MLLNELVDRYKSEEKFTCALEARRYQCFSFIGNLQYQKAREHIHILFKEANEAGEERYVGVGEMLLGIVSLHAGESDLAVEYFARAIQVGTDLEDADLLYRVQMNLGYAQMTLERYEQALDSFKLSIRHFDVDDAFVTNGPVYYNIAFATIHIAFQACLDQALTEEHIEQAKKSIENAANECGEDTQLHTLIEILRSLYLGLAERPQTGLNHLAEFKKIAFQDSVVSTSITYFAIECRLLELKEDWAELCKKSQMLLDQMRASKAFASIQAVLRQSANAHAKQGDHKTAYEMLLESSTEFNRNRGLQGEHRAQVINLSLDLQRQKFDQDVLRMRNKTLIERNKILEQEARFDPLSGILNRRGTEEALQQYSERRFADRFAIALLDIDHFKRINDSFGHATGDQVIHDFASCLANSATNPSKLGRWGGEEFLIVFDISDEREMELLGKTLINEIRNISWDHIQPGLRVTASCGLAMWQTGDSIDAAIRMADDLLYDVKHNGRNNYRVESLDQAA